MVEVIHLWQNSHPKGEYYNLYNLRTDKVKHTYNPRSQEAEVGR